MNCYRFLAALVGASLGAAQPVFAHGFAGPHYVHQHTADRRSECGR